MKLFEKIWQKIKHAIWWVCHEFLYYLGWIVGPTVAFIISKPEMKGKEKIPRSGGVILTMNHLSNWDLVYIYYLMPRSSYFMTKREYFEFPFVGGLVRFLGAFPVSRGKYDRQAIQYAVDLLNQGKQVVVFPEGTRSKTSDLQEGHSGAALIAAQSGATIVPIAITGTEKISRRKEYGPNGKKIKPVVKVQVGEPYRLPNLDSKIKRENLEEQSDLMMGKIAELLPPQYQGVYTPAKMAERKLDRKQARAERLAHRAEAKTAQKESLEA